MLQIKKEGPNILFMIKNPMIKGFNPDPSICKREGKYYLAVSTFEFFPGVSVYESEDLSSWTYVSSILSTKQLLPLKNCQNSTGGIYAPTLRYHDGFFFMVTTNKNTKSNFLCYARDIKGPWEGPFFIRSNGIDPSLFFDEDGSCFYTSNGKLADGSKGILGFYIDPFTGKRLSEEKLITEGVSKHATEAPHIYKVNGLYYLIFAEGGTGMGHHEMCMRAVSLSGPWEVNPRPILSHVDRKDHVIQATGHADIFQAFDGSWYAVFLAKRKVHKPSLFQLGRETFLAPVKWVDGWPIIGDEGQLELEIADDKIDSRHEDTLFVDFEKDLSNYPLLSLREQCEYALDGNTLTLIGKEDISTPLASPSMLFIRQTEFCSSFKATLEPSSIEGEAGVVAWLTNLYYYKLAVTKEKASLLIMVHGFEALKAEIAIEETKPAELEIDTSKDEYSFFVNGQALGSASYAGLCPEASLEMLFTGVLFGIYAERGKATFLKGIERTDR